jgi:asparagine synthase (glutamine-hydrolysing)
VEVKERCGARTRFFTSFSADLINRTKFVSGIAAILNLDGRPAERLQLEPMLAAIAHRGADGIGRSYDGPAALGHAMLRVTPESFAEVQPLCDQTGATRLTFDGRIDNRRELREMIEASGVELRSDTDPELVLKAYLSLGENCVRKVLGDFAFVIWDSDRRRLFCARDYSGIRPFYYYCDGKTFVAASELQQILRHPGVPQEPNEGLVGEYLTGRLITREETLYRGVMRLAPAHMMIVTEHGPRISRYYDLDPSRAIRYSTDDQYGAHFLEIFKDAIRCRMRARNGVAAELSGGVDSSSIVCTVESMIRAGEVSTPRFETFSLVYSEPRSDERIYANEVASMWNLKLNWIQPYEIDLQASIDGVRRTREWGEHPNGAQFRTLRQAVADTGMRVLLTGLGGDQWLTGSEFYYAELLSELRFGDLMRLLKTDWRFGIPGSPGHNRLRLLLRWGLLPMLPDKVRHRLSDAVRRERFPAFIPKDFARRINLLGRLRSHPRQPAGISFSQRTIFEVFVNGWMAHVMELEDRHSAQAGIEQWHPFYDLRLIEFCLAIPEEQRTHNNYIKWVLRNAMKGLLPENIRTRLTKAEFSETFLRLFDRVGGANFFDHLNIGEKGWVDSDRARELAKQRLSNPSSNLWPLMNTFAIEVWYNTVFRDGGHLLSRVAPKEGASP